MFVLLRGACFLRPVIEKDKGMGIALWVRVFLYLGSIGPSGAGQGKKTELHTGCWLMEWGVGV